VIELAIAFVIRHSAVTSAIIGPRTTEHLESQLTAADVTLDDATLHRIDELVPSGTNVDSVEAGWSPGPDQAGAAPPQVPDPPRPSAP
jgi:diketogulonate reductase-like aldo/keto reductase